jgi:hypothetical protein
MVLFFEMELEQEGRNVIYEAARKGSTYVKSIL